MKNSRLLKSILLAEGEKIILIARPSMWRWFWPLLLSIILIFGDFFFLYPLVQWENWGLIIFALIQFLALVILTKTSRRHYYTALILTSRKIIDLDQLGYFSRAISQHPLGKIGHVRGKTSGVSGAFLGLGDIIISLPETGSEIVIAKIKNFKNTVSIIVSEQEKYLQRHSGQAKNPGERLARLTNQMNEEMRQDSIGEDD